MAGYYFWYRKELRECVCIPLGPFLSSQT